MDIRIQIIVATFIIFSLCVVINLIRQKKIDLKYALLWIVLGVAILILDCFPILITKISQMSGIASPINMLFFCGFCFSLIIIFVMTMAISRLSTRVTVLAQKIALFEKEYQTYIKSDLSE